MGRGVNTGALSPVGGIGEIRMRANPRKIVAYKDFAKQMVMAQYEKKSRRIVKKMSKKSLINKKALRYIIANSNLCKHAIREL